MGKRATAPKRRASQQPEVDATEADPAEVEQPEEAPQSKRLRSKAPAAEEAAEAEEEEEDEEDTGKEAQEEDGEEGEEEDGEADGDAEVVAPAEAADAAEAVAPADEPGEQLVVTPGGAPAAEVVKAPTPRLMIREIILENFKSYGNQKLIGPFHKSFSSIVGPNGSGKSNTIDALLFVFGKRAKQMRLRKVSELIHSSAALPNVGSAKVTVTFQDIVDTGDGPEDYEVVEGSVLQVSREAFRNNSSKYYVDGKTSNFTDVTQLLRKRGVDLEHNRFLILQGEVEQIAMMKPKAVKDEDGLLEYLEDIIGSIRLVEPIEKGEAVVEQLTEQRQEKLNRLRVAERERDSLDGPRKEAEAWVTAEAERLELQALVSQAEARRSHSSLAGLEAEQKKLQAHMEQHRKKMEGFEKDVKAIETEHNTHLGDYNKIKAQMEKAALDFKAFESQDVKFTEDIAFQEQKIQKLQVTSEKESENATKLLADAEQLRNDAPNRELELQNAEKHRATVAQKVEKIFAGLKGKAEKLRPLKEAKEKELVPLQHRLTEVQKVVSVAQTEAQFLREKTSQVTEQIEELKQQHAECGSRLKTREQEVKEATGLKSKSSTLAAEAKERLGFVAKQMEEVTKEVGATRVKAEEARSQFEEEHTRGRLIRSVYEASKAGKLKGVHGRLGDLGTIPKKYDVAVSTACGMLDAIVVDSTADAQAVIEYIRHNDLGRATCIALEKIREREAEMRKPIQTPEGAPRLIDLIKPTHDQYKVAFYFALQHTLVAKDLDQATRIGVQGTRRWRVVTLDGKLIDTSGTMSGGGNQVAKGGMRASLCLYSPEEVKAFVESHEKASAKLSAVRHEKAALEEALQMTDKEIAEYQLREEKCNMDVTSLQKQLEAYDQRLKTLKVPTLNAGEKSKLKELEKSIAAREGELNDIQQKHHAAEEEVRDLHNQIMNIGGGELKQAKADLEEATKNCDELRKFVKKALLDADTMVKNSKVAEEKAKTALKEKKVAEKVLTELKQEHAKLDDKAEVVLRSLEELRVSLEQKGEVLVKLKEKRNEVVEAAQALKNSEVDLVNEIEEKTRTLKDLYSRIAAWGAKLEEARKEYAQLPLEILADLRQQAGSENAVDTYSELGRRAVNQDLPEDELEQVVRADVDARMMTLEANVKNLKPNLTSIEEFRKADAEHKSRLADYEAINTQREDARKELEGLRQQRLEEFMEGFSVISMKLKEMYQMITLGGDAELELVDTLDPFSEGINFSVRPPKKSWKVITNLSGGEKTLASLSLVFALHHYKPTPLYFMDEIDAALDFRNVSIIANYIKERTKNAQFIVISLRNHMFELADLLVGIYKTSDISKSVAINPTAFEVKNPPLQVKDANQAAIEYDRAGASKRALPPVPLEAPPASKRRGA